MSYRYRYGLPHALHKFSASPDFPVGEGSDRRRMFAEIVLQALSAMLDYSHLALGREAHHFLLEDDEMFPAYCNEAGIDGGKFRYHLWACERGEVTEEMLETL
jgi:hypothetical protein